MAVVVIRAWRGRMPPAAWPDEVTAFGLVTIVLEWLTAEEVPGSLPGVRHLQTTKVDLPISTDV